MTQLKRLSALTLAILLAFALNVSSASAQDTVVPDDGSIQQQQDPSTPGDGQVGGTTGTTNQTFNWWWLLPLLLIPLLFLLGRRETDRNDRSYDDRTFAGSKGGRARTDDDGPTF